jgi:hypothetical protein
MAARQAVLQDAVATPSTLEMASIPLPTLFVLAIVAMMIGFARNRPH